MIVFPNAKINLGLNIVERRPDGYHNLETVFYPIRLEDVLEVVSTPKEHDTQIHKSPDYTLDIKGIPVAGNLDDNLVVKAYRMLAEEFNLPAIHIYMYKHIPSGAGLGGGSSDAAFMMKLIRDKFMLPLTDRELEGKVARLGADCAFFVRNQPTFATGIGNLFAPVSLSLKGYYLALVKPDVFVSTKDAFALIHPQKPVCSLPEIIQYPVEEWKTRGMCNDFERSVFAKYPAIEKVKDELYAMGALYASMSGSGSSVYGIFKTPVEKNELEVRFVGSFCHAEALV